jgi:hypothetical protein
MRLAAILKVFIIMPLNMPYLPKHLYYMAEEPREMDVMTTVPTKMTIDGFKLKILQRAICKLQGLSLYIQ